MSMMKQDWVNEALEIEFQEMEKELENKKKRKMIKHKKSQKKIGKLERWLKKWIKNK